MKEGDIGAEIKGVSSSIIHQGELRESTAGREDKRSKRVTRMSKRNHESCVKVPNTTMQNKCERSGKRK